MLYAGLGDAMGYKKGDWEFEKDAQKMLADIHQLGGISNILVDEENWPVSDDTVMHMATCIAVWQVFHPNMAVCQAIEDLSASPEPFDVLLLSCGKIVERYKPSTSTKVEFDTHKLGQFSSAIVAWYSKCMSIMKGRAPGRQTVDVVSRYLSQGVLPPNEIVSSAGGNGAAMRSMCLGLISCSPQIIVSLAGTASAATHPNYTAILGGIMSAAFTSMALNAIHPIKWPMLFFADYYPSALIWLKKRYPKDEVDLYFYNVWQRFMKERFVNYSEGVSLKKCIPRAKYPHDWAENVAAREAFYEKFAFESADGNKWIGSSGHDSVLIAYDAILYCPDNWHNMLLLALVHGGDSDSTASIAGAFFGALVGMRSHTMVGLEFQESIVSLATGLPLIQLQDIPVIL